MELAFVKMHGLGNDFIVVEDLAEELELSAEAVEWFCDRNFGIGADGLILVRPSTLPEADFFMLYYNSDGTVAEMCGNGIRCFAKYLVDYELIPADQDDLVVETLGGLKPISVTRAYDGGMYLATVNMGAPVLEAGGHPHGDALWRQRGHGHRVPARDGSGHLRGHPGLDGQSPLRAVGRRRR